MAQTLNLPNFKSNNILVGSQTILSANVSAAASSLPVLNAQNYTSQYLLVGIPGADTAELLPNTSVNSGTSIALTSNTVLAHYQNDPVMALFGNQIKIYRATDAGQGLEPPDSSFSLIATQPLGSASADTRE